MPNYILLRVQREASPQNSDETVIKFYPIKSRLDGENLVINAPDESIAFDIGVFRLPALRRFLAVEELGRYTATITRLLAQRVQRELATAGARAQGQNSSRGKTPSRGPDDVHDNRVIRPRQTADQADNPA